jgi:magnesium transporter
MRPILSLSFQDLKAEVISELNDLEHAKILSICCVMMRTLRGIDGEGVKVNENWNVLTCVKEMHSG